MKTLFTLSALLILNSNLYAQEFKFESSYQYLHSSEWNRAIQTYNFSRPFLTENQPLLTNGFNATIKYIFSSEKQLRHGINLGYSTHTSTADNVKFINTVHAHFFNLGYLILFQNIMNIDKLYAETSTSIMLHGVYRNVNNKPFMIDESRVKALGIGGEISINVGYQIYSNKKVQISPFIGIGYCPYFFAPNTETILNQTKGLIGDNFTNIATVKTGISIGFKN